MMIEPPVELDKANVWIYHLYHHFKFCNLSPPTIQPRKPRCHNRPMQNHYHLPSSSISKPRPHSLRPTSNPLNPLLRPPCHPIRPPPRPSPKAHPIQHKPIHQPIHHLNLPLLPSYRQRPRPRRPPIRRHLQPALHLRLDLHRRHPQVRLPVRGRMIRLAQDGGEQAAGASVSRPGWSPAIQPLVRHAKRAWMMSCTIWSEDWRMVGPNMRMTMR
jgi:hypothetical protein